MKDFKFSYNLSVLIQYNKHIKHLIPIINNEHSSRYKKNIHINVSHFKKVFGQSNILYIGLSL